MMFECIDKIYPSVSIDTVTGSICTFTDNIGGLPLKSCTSLITGYQEGSGTPSPSNVRPLHAWSGANICNVSNYGSWFRGIYQGIYGFVDLGSLNWNYQATYHYMYARLNDGKYTNSSVGLNGLCSLYEVDATNSYLSLPDKCMIVGSDFVTINVCSVVVNDSSYTDANAFKAAMNGVYLIYELATPTTPTITPEQFETLCQAFGITGNTYTFSFGQSIYHGSIDWLRGVVVGTWGYIASYNGETISGEWLCDRAVYDAGTTPPTGSQVAYELATPIEIPLGGINLLTQKGQNNIFADCGDTTVEYINIT